MAKDLNHIAMREQTTKQRQSRIDPEYYKRRDRLTLLKFGLAVGALVITGPLIAWAAASLTAGWNSWPSSPGPVAAVHASWENRCDSCHQQFHSIQTVNRCGTCHGGPVHFEGHAGEQGFTVQTPEENNCAICHVDHRGRGASLVRVSDLACTGCHRDLPAVRPNAKCKYFAAISDFSRDHPKESCSLAKFDPDMHRTLKFSHVIHLSAGMVLDSKNPRAFRLRDIEDPQQQRRYQSLQGASDLLAPVHLDCGACHRVDAGDLYPGSHESASRLPALAGLPQAAVLPHRAAGGNPLPITYELHCKACHPLESVDGRQTPHRLQPSKLREFYNDAYAARTLAGQPPESLLIDRVPQPGKPPDPKLLAARTVVEGLVAHEERRLATATCAKCHQFEDASLPFFQRTVRLARAHDVWYEHARFTHLAHRAVSCRECHPEAYRVADPQVQPPDLEPSLVPQVKKCMECHGPTHEANGKPAGGARSDCVECHRYHLGSAPLQGLGAELRDPGGGDLNRRLSGEEFLRGEPSNRSGRSPTQ